MVAEEREFMSGFLMISLFEHKELTRLLLNILCLPFAVFMPQRLPNGEWKFFWYLAKPCGLQTFRKGVLLCFYSSFVFVWSRCLNRTDIMLLRNVHWKGKNKKRNNLQSAFQLYTMYT